MSYINIEGAVKNIRATTNIYTPIVESIVNAIQAIESNNGVEGKILIRAYRDEQQRLGLDDSLPEIKSFEIEDNGIGFNDENQKSFDTLYTDLKIKEGGKGFGRLTYLKYFDKTSVSSVFKDRDGFQQRAFAMGKDADFIVEENICSAVDKNQTGTIVKLETLKEGEFPKTLPIVARYLVEKILPYFIAKDYKCPEVTLAEADGGDSILLNNFVGNELSATIKEISVKDSDFVLPSSKGDEKFTVKLFKFYSPNNQKSKISLIAHKREVSSSTIERYIPEFEEEFCDKITNGGKACEKNYIVKAYVFSDYLNDHVSLERSDFEFKKETDLFFGISQLDIERKVATIAKDALGEEITTRQNKKRERVKAYVDENAPWHKGSLGETDLSTLPYRASGEQIELHFQKEKIGRESKIKIDVTGLLEDADFNNSEEKILQILAEISETSKNDLTHYIAMRKNTLSILERSLELDADGKFSLEGVVHNIIFPIKGDSDRTPYDEHNLWIIDERLNFANYISSDLPLSGGKSKRPDLLAWGKRVSFRGDNEASNPVTIFEFKRPGRDDFVNPSSKEDPIQQIVSYVNDIKDGKYKTLAGRKMLILPNTPFYGYVVCDVNEKAATWLVKYQEFKPMPDSLGWFRWFTNINLYLEVLSWDKVLKDANMRNKIFFHKLGI